MLNNFYMLYSQLRDERKLTDYRIAKATGIGYSSFADWRKGNCQPSLKSIVKIASYLGVSVNKLL